jgi:large subunit ribosomal protein L10
MSKYVKGLLQKELEQKFAEVADFLVLDTRGINGNKNNELRGALKGKGIKLTVVKNVLMRRALEGKGMSSALSLFLAGPCTVAYGGDSVVDIAKECVDWSKKVEAIQFKGAFVDGSVMDGEGVKTLAKLPSLSELQGTIVLLARSPGARVAGAVAGPGGIIAGCIKSLVDKLEEAA